MDKKKGFHNYENRELFNILNVDNQLYNKQFSRHEYRHSYPDFRRS